MNPASIKLLVIAGLILAAAIAGDRFGYTRGVNEQKVEDQIQFDNINAERAQQKVEANALYQTAQADIIALQVQRAELNRKLEAQDATNRANTDALTRKYAALSLRFGTGQGGADRPHGAGAGSTPADTPDADAATVVQLPDAIARDLRSLVADADKLADQYRKCYASYYPVN